ncbi:dihydroorotate dehydrogenase electron transfer subunit [Peptoniphilus harei]|uniref:Dihydrdoorotate oxidase B, electron transfer subunit n=1 Tax=Peptoniphilus harei TaxID=54005 RepID=A0A2X1XUL2_9FIRM|nr:dihydroorotate dehydrogenase electron transfer subunit [Peptoniphilus harei]QQT91474.1 dihydroorotate dehydrogenase electron transfer subunit [Peptoniphilus harei]SPY46427.1 Dihydrdoorotate oxidase B, electron transfer subunit [Peptoniphilus harei]
MAKIIENIDVCKDYFILRTDLDVKVYPGQFFMLRAWESYPTLSRPISVYDVTDGVDFLIEKRGEGTKILESLKEGDEIKLFGPFGNAFYANVDEVALVGGGVGVAPFHYLIKEIQKLKPSSKITLYIGEREELELENAFKDIDCDIKIKKGGFITDIIDFESHDLIYTCGPEIMMKKVVELAKDHDVITYVSLEKRMGCGLGACLSCSCETKRGRRRSCKEGPIFKGSDLIDF